MKKFGSPEENFSAPPVASVEKAPNICIALSATANLFSIALEAAR
jgi:hypothetical protein